MGEQRRGPWTHPNNWAASEVRIVMWYGGSEHCWLGGRLSTRAHRRPLGGEGSTRQQPVHTASRVRPASGLSSRRAWARLVLLVVHLATVLLLLRMGQAASPLVGYLPLAAPVHELQDYHYAPLETRSIGPTAAQCVWLVLREWPLKRY